ncbi:hypothetical protein [Pseudohongiella sp.]|uniref:DUF2306 domain-containing protein n=1 Tax=marine sediment metagenome TaxID=412755 RepID=A0A0F9YQB6_9ZZZZ|nr:hypothetical protein [Pseudohongiella sp.]HDZ10067.1 hypothetical protein [Pseudohongiella sp.]HEA63416.1 hypothetical protein [Pseudohongiella sp.]
MYWLHQSALYLHIVVGVIALIMFWIPVVSKKGARNHKRFGRIFAIVMYTVGWSGVLMASFDLWRPLVTHPVAQSTTAEAQTAISAGIRASATFLLSLSILVLATTRHGWLVIRHKDDRRALRRPAHVALCLALLGAGLTLLVIGGSSGNILMLIFGALETWLAIGFLRYSFKAELAHPREWWVEHLGSLIGSGIGVYTAFFVFGAARLLQPLLESGSFAGLGVVFWVAPGAIGGIAIARLSRKYRRRFSAEPG